MRTRIRIRTWAIATLVCVVAITAVARSNRNGMPASGNAPEPLNVRYEDVKWQSIVPELGDDSPQISILRVDPQTKATQLLIRTPRQMHVPMHWHSADETHTIIQGTATFEHDGKLQQLTSGGFNYMSAKMNHQAWTSDGTVLFITVDHAWDVNWVGNPPGKSDLGQIPPAVP